MDKTKGNLIFDDLPEGTHTYWFVNGTGYQRIDPGQKLDGVDLERSPELKHQIEAGHARWEDEVPKRRTRAEGGE